MVQMASQVVRAKMPTLVAGSKRGAFGSPGFTLIEVLVVLVILALAMAIVVPAISKTQGESLDDVARELQIAFRQARSDAVLTQRTSAVLVDVANRRFRQERVRSDKAIPQKITVTASVATSELRNGTAGIRFFPDGSSTGGFISLSIGESSSRVEVDWLTGRISIAREGG